MSRIGILLLTLMLAHTAAPASATVAAECVAGSAAMAGPERPHLVDPAGDQSETDTVSGLINRPANDLSGFWIGVEGGRPPEDPRFTANFRVPLDAHPVGLTLVFQAEGHAYDWARALPDGTWAFQSGGLLAIAPVGTNILLQPDSLLSGAAQPINGVVRIVLAPELHPRYEPGVDVVMPEFTVIAGYSAFPPVAADGSAPRMLPVQLNISDTGANGSACQAVLYEAEADART